MDEYSFNPMRIWFRILALPKPLMEDPDRTHLVGQSLGAMVGTALRTDTRKREGNMTEFLRVEILMDISKLVRRFLLIGKGTRTTSCHLQYERLPLLCHGCGIISHVFENCPNKAAINPAKLQYSEWLEWLPPRRRDQGPRGRIRAVEPSTNASRQQPPIDLKDKGKSIAEPVASAPEPGKLNDGDDASFADLPTEDANPNDELVVEESSELPISKEDHQKPSRVTLPPRVIAPQPLNTIFPIPENSENGDWEAQDDSVPSPTAQQVNNLDAQLTSAPAPIPIPTNRGTKRRSSIQVILQPKKSRPSPSSTSKAGIGSGKNSPAAADAQPRRGK